MWTYGKALRTLAKARFPHIKFSRLSRLISEDCKEATTMDEYVLKAPWYREQIMNKYLPVNFDVGAELIDDKNSLMTYRGYIKFLGADLKHSEDRQGLSRSQVKRMNEMTAKKMIVRGKVILYMIGSSLVKLISIGFLKRHQQGISQRCQTIYSCFRQ